MEHQSHHTGGLLHYRLSTGESYEQWPVAQPQGKWILIHLDHKNIITWTKLTKKLERFTFAWVILSL